MIAFAQAQVATGSTVEGRISGGGVDATVAWLVWRLSPVVRVPGESVRAIEDYVVVGKRPLDATAFTFAIPEQGPLSYEGPLIRVVWEIVAGSESSRGPQITEHGTFTVVACPASSRALSRPA